MYNPNKSVKDRVAAALLMFSDKETCWEWPKSKTKAGYGQLTTSNGSAQSRELHYAHRVAFVITNHAIPKGLFVCHKCDNPSCFNPNHLFLGSQKDNIMDCSRKGRLRPAPKYGDEHWARKNPEKAARIFRGESNPTSKLKEQDVKYIRNSMESHASLARKYNVSPTTISDVRIRKIWKHLV